MGDEPQAQTLTVTVDGQPMTLQAFLALADNALATAQNIPDNATVTLTDHTVMSGAAYKQYAENAHSQAYQEAYAYLDKVGQFMTLIAGAFTDLGGHLSSNGDAVRRLKHDIEAGLHGWEAAAGNDDVGKDFVPKAQKAIQDLFTDMDTLAKSLDNLGGGSTDCGTWTTGCEKKTMAVFGK